MRRGVGWLLLATSLALSPRAQASLPFWLQRPSLEDDARRLAIRIFANEVAPQVFGPSDFAFCVQVGDSYWQRFNPGPRLQRLLEEDVVLQRSRSLFLPGSSCDLSSPWAHPLRPDGRDYVPLQVVVSTVAWEGEESLTVVAQSWGAFYNLSLTVHVRRNGGSWAAASAEGKYQTCDEQKRMGPIAFVPPTADSTIERVLGTLTWSPE